MEKDIHNLSTECEERRKGMREFNDRLEKLESYIESIHACLMGDLEKQGAISKLAICEKTINKHIDDHWKFTGIGIGITGICIALATLLTNAFKFGANK